MLFETGSAQTMKNLAAPFVGLNGQKVETCRTSTLKTGKSRVCQTTESQVLQGIKLLNPHSEVQK